jgi:hypothetical protein
MEEKWNQNQLWIYSNSILQILKSHKDLEEDNKEAGVEEWRKLISNSAIKFPDYVTAECNHNDNDHHDHTGPVSQ